MSEKAIRVAGLGKEYQLGTRERAHTTFRDVLAAILAAPFHRLRRLSGATEPITSFWALKDVSFDVEPGEVVGIIGRNGAGKSTLLKILSQITEPTTGEVTLNGRVSSLLEVGTGFHPELTGRENIYLNGAILGMSRVEIKRKFDEIVAFAEVEKFLDTPVKRYSSGMYVRLAFAVAAHLEPEILIVDEVLAVGDAAFQKKCLGKMGEVAKGGRTVLFVSHNMGAVRTLCSRGILLQAGHLVAAGDVHRVLDVYHQERTASARFIPLAERQDREGNGRIRITDFSVHAVEGSRLDYVSAGQDVVFRITCRCREREDRLDHVVSSIGLTDQDRRYYLFVRSNFTADYFDLGPNQSVLECYVRDFPLAAGTYNVELFLSHRDSEVLDFVPEAGNLRVEPGDFFGTGNPGMPTHCRVLTRAEWRCTPVGSSS